MLVSFKENGRCHFPLNQFLPFIYLGRQQENTNHGSALLSQEKFGSLALSKATKLVFSSKGQELDPVKLSFQGPFLPLIQSCT